jgi:Bacterial regulatory helix-turn-helix protein, lysR family
MTGEHLDWDNLRYFLAVARAGKLTAAARRLGQDHTTVGRRNSTQHRRAHATCRGVGAHRRAR